ncbi:MAG: hypothetical protein ACPKPY_11505 [Nitrososphaeraceae archaeon]
MRPDQIKEYLGGIMNISTELYETLNFYSGLSTIISFLGIWITTTIVLYSSKSKLSMQIKYSLIIIVPLIYFLTGYFYQNTIYKFLFSFDFTNPIFISIWITLIFSLSKPVGGIIFGMVFWKTSKLFQYHKLIKEYLIYTGIGFALLFSANQLNTLSFAPYPPDGIASATILIFSSYLILIGISTSAIFIARDIKLRKSIYQVAQDSKLLNIISSAEMEKELRKTTNKIMKNIELNKNDDDHIDEDELKMYIESVIKELKNKSS